MKVCKLRTKKSYDIDTRAQCYKTFSVHDLRICILSQSVCQTRLEKLTNDKHSSLVRKSTNHRQKRFYNIDTKAQCYKTFSVHDLRIFALSQSVCQTRPEKLTNDKHSSLVRKSANHGQKEFHNIGPGDNFIKLSLSVICRFSY